MVDWHEGYTNSLVTLIRRLGENLQEVSMRVTKLERDKEEEDTYRMEQNERADQS